ncbi:MAG TPA: hypothetical protein VKT82_31635 [Ktedonobacterales bacterium]|nr:hypothetical protein [Ktedonobacterales bacterium]
MDTQKKAQQFFEHNGRDIDQAQWAHHFGKASLDHLLTVLARYQNPDGGFRGLEVDIKAPESNPFATELALLICLQANTPREHPLLQKTVVYLEQTQEENGNWRFVPGIYEYELAPWFQGWEWPNLNPTCTISGLLKELGLGSERLHARVKHLFTQLARVEDLTSDEFYSVRPYAYYFLPEWTYPQRELYISGVLWWLIRQHFGDKGLDGNHFFAYVRHPNTYTARNLPESILSKQLDRLQAEQEDDGGWPTPYDTNWRGWTTIQNLIILRAFGRI